MGSDDPEDWKGSREVEELRMARARRQLLEFELRARKTLLTVTVVLIVSVYVAAAVGELSLQVAIPLAAGALSGAAWLARSGIGRAEP